MNSRQPVSVHPEQVAWLVIASVNLNQTVTSLRLMLSASTFRGGPIRLNSSLGDSLLIILPPV
jgi:hypothetical protein